MIGDFVVVPHRPEPERDVLENLREALAAVTLHVVVHPDDLERVQTAADELAGPPVVVLASLAASPGRAVLLPPSDRLRVTRLPTPDLQESPA